MINIYLDDIRHPISSYNYTKDERYISLEWIIVRNYKEFINCVKENDVDNINFISFDHDLSEEHYDLVGKTDYLSFEEYYNNPDREMTGYDCAKWLCDYCYDNNYKFPYYLIHSWNMTGSKNIRTYINNFLKFNPELKK